MKVAGLTSSFTSLQKNSTTRLSTLERRNNVMQFKSGSARAVATASIKGHSYNVEVECQEDEDPEGALKRFRNSCDQAGMVYEARKRQYFENRQDIKKRKQQEKGLKKIRASKDKFLVTYNDAHSDTPPFTDLFQGQDDIYDILGDIDGYENDYLGSGRRRPARRDVPENSLGTSENGAEEEAKEAQSAPPAEQLISRSVQSQGPALDTQTSSSNNSVPKPKSSKKGPVSTARTRREQKAKEKLAAGRA